MKVLFSIKYIEIYRELFPSTDSTILSGFLSGSSIWDCGVQFLVSRVGKAGKQSLPYQNHTWAKAALVEVFNVAQKCLCKPPNAIQM